MYNYLDTGDKRELRKGQRLVAITRVYLLLPVPQTGCRQGPLHAFSRQAQDNKKGWHRCQPFLWLICLYSVLRTAAADRTTFASSGLSLFTGPFVCSPHSMSSFAALAGDFTLFFLAH